MDRLLVERGEEEVTHQRVKRIKELLKGVAPHKSDPQDVFYRPFIPRPINEASFDIYLMGINPATPISVQQYSLDYYVRALVCPIKYKKMYSDIRGGNGKSSRTRIGIASFSEELRTRTGLNVLETNVIPYPTRSLKELRCYEREHPNVIHQAESLFYELLLIDQPKVLIVYSKASLLYLLNILEARNLLKFNDDLRVLIKKPIRVLEKESTLQFVYPTGEEAEIFICRHLMYYGHHGKSFTDFKARIFNSLLITDEDSKKGLLKNY